MAVVVRDAITLPWAVSAAEHPGVRRARHFIDVNFAAGISVQQLGREAGLSPFHFARLFRRTTGITPWAYVLHRRVERAAELLRGGLPISQTAYDTGFTDQSHLTRHFKRIVGVSPGRYVRECVAAG